MLLMVTLHISDGLQRVSMCNCRDQLDSAVARPAVR
jgi:hypothetical protein